MNTGMTVQTISAVVLWSQVAGLTPSFFLKATSA